MIATMLGKRPMTIALKLYGTFHHERITYTPASSLIFTVNGIYDGKMS